MTYAGSLPSGQSPFPGQPTQQQPQQQLQNYSPSQQYAPQSPFQGQHHQYQAQQTQQQQQQQHAMFQQPQQLQSHPPQQQQNTYPQAQVFPNHQLNYDFNGFRQPQIPAGQNAWAFNNGTMYGNGNIGDGGVNGGMRMPVNDQFMASQNVMWQQPHQQPQPEQVQQRQGRQPTAFPGQAMPATQSRPMPMPSGGHMQAQGQLQQMPGRSHQMLPPQQHVQDHQQQLQQQQQQQGSRPSQRRQSQSQPQLAPQPSPTRLQQPPDLHNQAQFHQQQNLQQQYHDPRQSPQATKPRISPPQQRAVPPQPQQRRPSIIQAQSPVQAQSQLQPQPPPQQMLQPSLSSPTQPTPPQIVPEPQAATPEPNFQTPVQPQMQFVNLQDIQNSPVTPSATITNGLNGSLPKFSSPTMQSIPRKPSGEMPNPAKTPQPKAQSIQTPQGVRKSASQSPAMTTSRLSSKSPAISSKPAPHIMAPTVIHIAEELIAKARSSAPAVAASLHPAEIEEYQKLIGTGLGCLETALQGQGLSPRQEARLRLRYAVILQEETENLMEAETTLSKGIIHCDKHRMLDLKYCMQYLMMKVLFQRNRKAALKALDQHIKDCDAYQHVHWSYAFRLLKASFHMEAGNAADATALDNLRSIHAFAHHRGDAALSVFASLTEALVLLKTSKGSHEMVQNCMAQAAKYQLDPSVQIPQLELLSLLVAFLTSLHRQKHDETTERLRALQKKIDDWQGPSSKADFRLPIRKHAPASQTIGRDTSAVIVPGDGGSDCDYLVMSFMSQMESTLLVFSLGGLTYLHKPSSSGKNQSYDLWRQGLKVLAHWDGMDSGAGSTSPAILSQAIKQRTWRADMQCYLNVLLGLLAASQCRWDIAMRNAETAEIQWPSSSKQEMLRVYIMYLKGVCYQGTGVFDVALSHFRDELLALQPANPAPKTAQRHLALFAAMNQLWIMQKPSHQNDALTIDLLNELEPLCSSHPNIEIRGTWQSVLATVQTNPPRQRNQRKEDAGRALSNIKGNTLATTIGLVIARDLLYNNLLGDQAWKCMQAAANWAVRSGNPLWQSVVDGIMAEFSDARNEREQSKKFWDRGVMEADQAFSRSF